MASFPSLKPSTRVFTPAGFPVAAFRSYSGRETRVRRGALAAGYGLSLSFSALTPAEAKAIRDHYIGQQGGFASFDLPAVIWSGITGYADLVASGYRWVYASPPDIADVSCGYQSVSVSLRGVYDYAALGFTAGSYEGSLTPTDESEWWDRTVTGACELTPETDPFSLVDILLHLDGQVGSATIIDSSDKQRLPQFLNSSAYTTADKKFGSASCLFIDDTRAIAWIGGVIGSSSFTVEMWFKASNPGIYVAGYFASASSFLNSDGFSIRGYSSNGLRVVVANGTLITGLFSYDAWHHLAVVGESGQKLSLFLDGVKKGDASYAYNFTNASYLLGAAGINTSPDVFIDEFRMTIGAARYSDNFTPPAEPFPDR